MRSSIVERGFISWRRNFGVWYFLLGLFASVASGEVLEFSSGDKRVQLIELYTSQGCSSCPAAERRLNSLLGKSGLWTEFVPVSFHVAYWDRLGWRDPFASSENTGRQYAQRKEGNVGSVYTPAFLVGGEEWRGYFKGADWPQSRGQARNLSCEVENDRLSIAFEGANVGLRCSVAILGVGLSTEVKRGENRNKRLEQEFVSLWFRDQDAGMSLELPRREDLAVAERYAIAVWVRQEGSLKPLQATGTWWEPR